MKLSRLAEDPTLMERFNRLVLEKKEPKNWLEAEFWEVYQKLSEHYAAPRQRADEDVEMVEHPGSSVFGALEENSLRRGLCNKPLMLTRNRNAQT